MKGDQKVNERKQGCGGEEVITQSERAREREREAGPSLNAVRLKFHSDRTFGEGSKR